MARQYSRRNGGRGRGGNSNKSRTNGHKSNSSSSEKKKGLQGHTFQSGKSEEYDTNEKFIINHIQQKFINGFDIAHALETREEYDFEIEVERENIYKR